MDATVALDLVLVGFGNVGRRFVELLEERRRTLEDEVRLRWRIIGILTRRHGAARNLDGLDAVAAGRLSAGGASLASLDRAASPGAGSGPPPESGSTFISELARAARERDPHRHVVVVETTVLDIARAEPAISHVRAGLEAGAHVITANKGPVAFAFRDLSRLARERGRSFLFEGAVMDGIPVFNLARETLPAVRVLGFRGVVNSTTNHILSAMEAGQEFDRALAEMQAAGIAEADASLDVDGWDAAAKTAALVNVLMDGAITPHDVERTGIAGLGRADIGAALGRGERWKLVSEAGYDGPRLIAKVAPRALPAGDMLARLDGMQNALIFRTDLLGEIGIVQLDSGLTQTAYALVSDLIAVARAVAGRGDHRP